VHDAGQNVREPGRRMYPAVTRVDGRSAEAGTQYRRSLDRQDAQSH
jgi:hypothetical protein